MLGPSMGIRVELIRSLSYQILVTLKFVTDDVSLVLNIVSIALSRRMSI